MRDITDARADGPAGLVRGDMGSKRCGAAARVAGNTLLAGVTLVDANFRGYFEHALSTRKIILAGRLQDRPMPDARRLIFDPQVPTVRYSGGSRLKCAVLQQGRKRRLSTG